jgi:hypothetical protein
MAISLASFLALGLADFKACRRPQRTRPRGIGRLSHRRADRFLPLGALLG